MPAPGGVGSASASALGDIFDDAAAALASGTLDSRTDRYVGRTSLRLDEKGWEDLVGAVDATLEWIPDMKRESVERLEAGQGPGLSATVSMLAYEAVDPSEDEA